MYVDYSLIFNNILYVISAEWESSISISDFFFFSIFTFYSVYLHFAVYFKECFLYDGKRNPENYDRTRYKKM